MSNKMLICPHCRKTYADDNLFCPEDGNALVAENEEETVVNPKIPFTGGGGGGYDPTINIPVGGAGGASGGFTPQPPPSPTPRPNPGGNNNILFAIIGGCVVIIGVLIYFLAAGGNSKPQYETVKNNTPTPSPTASPAPTSEPKPAANTAAPVNAPPADPNPPPISRPRIPEGVERTYRGTSYVNGNLPLTMTLERNGSVLNGSAMTPGDEDRLSGTIGPDGSFDLEGYNYKAGRVTGNWRGTISESGEINGTWYANNGRRVRFYAK